VDVCAYLARIGAGRGDSLRDLVGRHLEAVPFENLSVHLREPIRLDPEPLVDKIVARWRGGFCYELNGAFALLLERLGYEVTRLACRVSVPGGFTAPGDHLAPAVRDRGRRMLVDVGFGRFAFGPIDLDTA
jgi:N-hydroxyarylamine O-acetyltransferase